MTAKAAAADLDFLSALRPHAETAEAVAEALERLPAVRDAVRLRLAKAEGDLRDRLVFGSPESVARAEAELADAQRDAKRVEAMAEHLQVELQRLQRAEAEAELEAERIALEEEAEKLSEWMRGRYHELAREISERLRHESAWLQRRAAWRDRLREIEGTALPSRDVASPGSRAGLPELAGNVRLPAYQDGFATNFYR